jgi:Ca-activated chloride channel family protein
MTNNRDIIAVAIVGVIGFGGALASVDWSVADLFMTPGQQGDRLMRQERFAEAAVTYRDPGRVGVALYRDGQFKEAISVFERMREPEMRFNLATAMVMFGWYGTADRVYSELLEDRPDWTAAKENREIARLRLEMLKKMAEEMMGDPNEPPDDVEIEFTKPDEGSQPQQTESDEQVEKSSLSDAELQALWLRRLQTKPGDFLRMKFAFQKAAEEQGGREQRGETR